jgi:hypothetical protein
MEQQGQVDASGNIVPVAAARTRRIVTTIEH